MKEKAVKNATQIGPTSFQRDVDKWDVLKAIRILEKSIHNTERKIYDIMTRQTIRPQGIPHLVKLDINKASDNLFNEFGFDELDVRYNAKRLNLVNDSDYKALMAEELEVSDKWLMQQDARVVDTIKLMRAKRLENWADIIAAPEQK
jgi:hypothetical protein